MKKIFVFLALTSFVLFSCNLDLKKEKTEAVEKDAPAQQDDLEKYLKEASGKLTAELLWKMGRVSGVTVSPDKSKILFGISKYNIGENSGKRDLYIIDINGGEPTQLTEDLGSIGHTIWRPDGKKIGFIAADGDSRQLWEMNPDGTDKKVVSDIEGGINAFEYAPDMKHILFIKNVKLDQTANEVHEDLPEANARIINELMYRHWDSWHDYAYSHIFYADYENGKVTNPVDIMEGERFDSPMNPWGGMEQVTWSPDGNKIAYVCKKLNGKDYTVSTNSEIYIYDLNTKETINLTAEGFEGFDKDPEFSPDGKMVVFHSMETPAFEADKERIIVYNFEDNTFTDFSKDFDQSSTHFVWSPEGDKIYFVSGTKATYQIYELALATNEIRQITAGKHNYQGIELAGDKIVATKMTMQYPTEIFKVNIQNGDAEQLTFTNNHIYDNITVAETEERWIKTTDGKDMLTWVIYPPDFDSTKKYPALLYCQGGPQSAVSQFFSFRWNFQMMAANDYIIVAPNRRGLPTFGQEWNDQISGDYGGQNMKDYLSAIDALKTESYIDEERLGAIGASYGGFSVYWLAGNHDNRFKAFIAHCGMYHFDSWYGTTEEMWFANKDIEGPYWENPKPKSYDFSPHLFVQNWNTPIMVIHGGNDFRVPYSQGMEAFNAAQLRGVESRFLYFPEESHFVLQPQNGILWQREFFKWLDEYLK
jgi:dipeptidyl aminopeptidase/acylaminoacyl peptidase